ncbi:hypothetical protein A33Q_1951 [Indibacter alkaliphilus LW1]|uniref:Uncharacterized protein n=1 Tax=Indibacter alkaliphilus (strain CCUG 57479 / KCTC 22604 / LW1) TaxID=1189612 RepID=S2E491_INDAL|nr:hypothetical protein [Indibacter alkaliphilus]EOZ97033.1 hypothetical protein A33Q_1951 [Indibacter alkaliphilus LW1]
MNRALQKCISFFAILALLSVLFSGVQLRGDRLYGEFYAETINEGTGQAEFTPFLSGIQIHKYSSKSKYFPLTDQIIHWKRKLTEFTQIQLKSIKTWEFKSHFSAASIEAFYTFHSFW